MLVYNAIRTPDGTLLESRHRHDYLEHKDANGETYMVDGGREYLRRNVTEEPYEELSLYLGDDHDKVREVVRWGKLLESGQVQWITVADLTTPHLEAILEGGHAGGAIKVVLLEEYWQRMEGR